MRLDSQDGEKLVPPQKFYDRFADSDRVGIPGLTGQKPVIAKHGTRTQIRHFRPIAAAVALQTHAAGPDAIYAVRRIAHSIN